MTHGTGQLGAWGPFTRQHLRSALLWPAVGRVLGLQYRAGRGPFSGFLTAPSETSNNGFRTSHIPSGVHCNVKMWNSLFKNY